jgi:hypothetical protein
MARAHARAIKNEAEAEAAAEALDRSAGLERLREPATEPVSVARRLRIALAPSSAARDGGLPCPEDT